MPGIITKIDGITAILFHVEHLPETEWFFRWRMIGDYPEPYLVWRSATAKRPWVKFQVEARDAIIEAEWRASEKHKWKPIPLWEILPSISGQFSFRSEEPFHTDEPFSVHSGVRGDGVGAYHFEPATIPAGHEVILEGRADAPAWANVLFAPGDFSPHVPGMQISNLAASKDWCRKVTASGPYPLSSCPIASARRVFAVGPHSVPSSLLT